MYEPKPTASLSPSLLARKGSARPAMRRQFQTHFNDSLARAAVEDDLGWNDLGEDQPAPAVVERAQPLAEVVPIYRALEPIEEEQPLHSASVTFISKPEALRQQDDITDRFEALEFSTDDSDELEADELADSERAESVRPVAEISDRLTKIVEIADQPRPGFLRRSALALGRKAAFTLRLDEARHLKLRLACTVVNRSAQQVVTDALDRMLAEMPEIDAMAVQVGSKREH
jgi:hypothetical protein